MPGLWLGTISRFRKCAAILCLASYLVVARKPTSTINKTDDNLDPVSARTVQLRCQPPQAG
jgi:hypothetical protein